MPRSHELFCRLYEEGRCKEAEFWNGKPQVGSIRVSCLGLDMYDFLTLCPEGGARPEMVRSSAKEGTPEHVRAAESGCHRVNGRYFEKRRQS
jgi:hypothetical protein